MYLRRRMEKAEFTPHKNGRVVQGKNIPPLRKSSCHHVHDVPVLRNTRRGQTRMPFPGRRGPRHGSRMGTEEVKPA